MSILSNVHKRFSGGIKNGSPKASLRISWFPYMAKYVLSNHFFLNIFAKIYLKIYANIFYSTNRFLKVYFKYRNIKIHLKIYFVFLFFNWTHTMYLKYILARKRNAVWVGSFILSAQPFSCISKILWKGEMDYSWLCFCGWYSF